MLTRLIYTAIVLIFLSAICGTVFARNSDQYNLNIYNGLPSNHVYCVLTDKYGYLWAGTDKGVVRYNGYEYKLYTTADGLPKNDVWSLYIDAAGKIWVCTIADEFGYIYKGKYKSCVQQPAYKAFRPFFLAEYNNTLTFLNNIYNNGSVLSVKNDTIHTCNFWYNSYFDMWCIKNNALYAANFDKGIYKCYFKNGRVRIAYKKIDPDVKNKYENTFLYPFGFNVWFNGFYIRFNPTEMDAFNILGEYRRIGIPVNKGEKINLYTLNKKKLYVYTNENVYRLNSELQIEAVFPIKTLIKNGPDKNIIYLYQDHYWGNCVATAANGVYVNANAADSGYFKTINNIDLAGYAFIGQINDSEYYWWNKNRNRLLCVNNGHVIKSYHYRSLPDVYNILPYNDKWSLLFGRQQAHWFDNSTGRIKKICDNMVCVHNNEVIPPKAISKLDIFSGIHDAALHNKHIFTVATSEQFLCHTIIKNDTIHTQNIDSERYNNIVYDNKKYFWVYNERKILLVDTANNKIAIPKKIVGLLGINNIDKILADEYGNVYIKSYSALYVFNYSTLKYFQLLQNYNLKYAQVNVFHDDLIVAGMFGIAFCKIKGATDISSPILYENVKNENYQQVYDMQTGKNGVFIKTDKGLLKVNIPHDSEFEERRDFSIPFRFIVNYNDDIFSLHYNDTIRITQKNEKIQLDVINAIGNGKVRYRYYISGNSYEWTTLNANELLLTHLQPGRFYTLSIAAYDDAWQSNTINVELYIIPYWWQTNTGNRLIMLGAIIMLVTIITLVYFITKRVITKKIAKRNAQLELEFKAIYLQINPHFIFNTLSSALLLIRKGQMEGAYRHIYRFSILLRSYIKSSRNRMIPIEEEIENLKNYVELQQTRFKNKFDYQIVIDEKIRSQQIKIPSLLLQPIIENAIDHGLFHKEEKGLLKIDFLFAHETRAIICIIDDNGIGRERSKVLKRESLIKRDSYGDKLIKDLINVFNKYEKMNIDIAYFDKVKPATGTTVKITIENPVYG